MSFWLKRGRVGFVIYLFGHRIGIGLDWPYSERQWSTLKTPLSWVKYIGAFGMLLSMSHSKVT
jgi:hypothetical protein